MVLLIQPMYLELSIFVFCALKHARRVSHNPKKMKVNTKIISIKMRILKIMRSLSGVSLYTMIISLHFWQTKHHDCISNGSYKGEAQAIQPWMGWRNTRKGAILCAFQTLLVPFHMLGQNLERECRYCNYHCLITVPKHWRRQSRISEIGTNTFFLLWLFTWLFSRLGQDSVLPILIIKKELRQMNLLNNDGSTPWMLSKL